MDSNLFHQRLHKLSCIGNICSLHIQVCEAWGVDSFAGEVWKVMDLDASRYGNYRHCDVTTIAPILSYSQAEALKPRRR
jgi:hypothetical protein